jgi:dihydrofolate reductase
VENELSQQKNMSFFGVFLKESINRQKNLSSFFLSFLPFLPSSSSCGFQSCSLSSKFFKTTMSNSPASETNPPRQMNLIVAVDAENGISKDNSLPWHLPKEYKHFQETTIKTSDPSKINAVLMGRKCWDSIPAKFRPLKNRVNVILSKTLPPQISEHCIITDDFDKALKMLTEEEPYKSQIETIWNVGGKAIYQMGLEHPWMHKLVITKIDSTFDTDVQFPDVDWENYELNDDFDGKLIEEKGFTYRIQSFTKKRSNE